MGMKPTSTSRTRRWREANKDKNNRYMRAYRGAPISSMLDDPEEYWFEKDPRKRKALKQATPSWADLEDIRQVYEQCEALNRRYPNTGFVVHHEIPISHPEVCGLHIAGNLKVVSASLKQKLGRKFHKK